MGTARADPTGGRGAATSRLHHRPGHARLVLTHTGPEELANHRSTALSAWQQHLQHLAHQLR